MTTISELQLAITEAQAEVNRIVESELNALRSSRLAPSDEPLSWDHTGAVTLDVAIHAIHLITARVLMRSIPGIFRSKVAALKRALEEFVIQKAAIKLGEKFGLTAIKKLIGPLTLMLEVFKAEELEIEVEAAIRRSCTRTARDVPILKMKPNPNRKRRRKRVASRHK